MEPGLWPAVPCTAAVNSAGSTTCPTHLARNTHAVAYEFIARSGAHLDGGVVAQAAIQPGHRGLRHSRRVGFGGAEEDIGNRVAELRSVGRVRIAEDGDREVLLGIAAQPYVVASGSAAVADFVEPSIVQHHEPRGVGDIAALVELALIQMVRDGELLIPAEQVADRGLGYITSLRTGRHRLPTGTPQPENGGDMMSCTTGDPNESQARFPCRSVHFLTSFIGCPNQHPAEGSFWCAAAPLSRKADIEAAWRARGGQAIGPGICLRSRSPARRDGRARRSQPRTARW